mmetsp:Transcript_11383/g.16326  ORF Transcript_11383/g.16326 Transcript_11383/m.16326 type:complete len:956 (+) Transcript_11383:286-3153(+)
MTPFGYQSGYPTPFSDDDDDSYPASFIYDAQHNLIYFTGVTYSTYFDKATNLPADILGAMGMSMTAPSVERGSDEEEYHLSSGDCFLGILKLPPPPTRASAKGGSAAAWWNKSNNSEPLTTPKLIYAKRFGTPQNSEACSSLLALPHDSVDDALLQSHSQLKLVLLGHVNPVPLSAKELEQLKTQQENAGQRLVLEEQQLETTRNDSAKIQMKEQNAAQSHQGQRHSKRSLEQPPPPKLNQGGLFTSISHNNSGGGGPLAHNGRAYGFLMDFDVSLTPNQDFQTSTPTNNNSLDMNNAYGALLGGYVLESAPLVYPIDLAHNVRDPNQIYVVSMHSDEEREVYNPEYTTSAEEEVNVELYARPDVTLGGAGGVASTSSSSSLGGVPKFGTDFYVKVEQITITPYEELLNVKPTSAEHVKQTMKSGWGFGFKLNDATDVRPSCVEFVKGRTPDEDLLLMGGTTRNKLADGSGAEEYDGFITKIIPPSPATVLDVTTGATVEEAASGNSDSIHNEGTHPTKRIDSTTGRDETVTAICLPPPDAGGMGVTHAFVVGSSTNPKGGKNGPSMAYLLKMRLDDMSTVWKEHVTSISSDGGVGGDVLGQGCAVSNDGKMVYLSGTIDGASGMRTGFANSDVKPVGGVSDVFVVSYDVEFGNVKWEQQLGTEYEDKLARGGGIKVDNDGNPMIMGSSRGALQRSREGNGRMASDIFFMNLSRENGAHINAPFTADNNDSVVGIALGSGSTKGVVVGIVVAVIFALLVIVVRRRRKTMKKEVERMWDRSHEDDFTYNGNPYASDEDRPSSGALRIVREGADDGWDDGSDRINKDSFWKKVSGGSEISSPQRFTSPSKYSRKVSDDHVSFLAKLREEASSSSKKLSSMISSDATDPRLDGGASIKNMLSQYREVKKESIISGDIKKSPLRSGKKMPNKSKPPPPPPPPRRNYEGEPDGLSEFTIV